MMASRAELAPGRPSGGDSRSVAAMAWHSASGIGAHHPVLSGLYGVVPKRYAARKLHLVRSTEPGPRS